MQPLDNPENRPESEAHNELFPQQSRRAFLKTIGATFVGAVVTSLPQSISGVQAESVTAQAPPDQVDAALAIAKISPMFQEAITELQVAGFGFNVAGDAVRISSTQDSLIGLVLPHSQSTSNRMGADLVLTVDLTNKLLNFVQSIVSWSLLDTLRVASSLFDARRALFLEPRSGRGQYNPPPHLIRPRLEERWNFARADSPAVQPTDLTLTGWPVELPTSHYWHYAGCSNATWTSADNLPLYRGSQVAEQRTTDTLQQRLLGLS